MLIPRDELDRQYTSPGMYIVADAALFPIARQLAGCNAINDRHIEVKNDTMRLRIIIGSLLDMNPKSLSFLDI